MDRPTRFYDELTGWQTCYPEVWYDYGSSGYRAGQYLAGHDGAILFDSHSEALKAHEHNTLYLPTE